MFYKTLRFQTFAEDDGSTIGGTGGADDTTNELSGEDELAAAIKSLLASEDTDDDDADDNSDNADNTNEDDDSDEDDSDNDDNSDDETDDNNQDNQNSDKTKGKKREQSREENAKFAAQRRQQEIDKQVEEKLNALKAQSPEYALAKMIADGYGVTPEVALQQIKEAQLQEQSTKTGIPIEHLKAQEVTNQKVDSLTAELNMLRFQAWETNIKADTTRLQDQYKMLTAEDFESAKNYILNIAKNVNLPLEDAVYAVHGKKIIENLANSKVQDKLADESGRSKKTPPAPKNGKAPTLLQATAEEKYIAKAMGMSIGDYLKYK